MSQVPDDKPDQSSSAPRYHVPPVELVGVEHPFLVKNLHKAIQSLGGPRSLARLLDRNQSEVPARLSLHPNDPLARTIGAGVVHGNNVLLKIQAPKLTGRKRKRGSNEPFRTQEELSASGQQSATPELSDQERLLRGLRDNPDRCEVSIVGQIARTHRFRDPPDFVYSNKPGGFLTRFKDSLLSGDYKKICNFQLDPNAVTHELLVSPTLAPSTIAYNYSYRQNVAVKTIEIDGKSMTFNSAVNQKLRVYGIRAEDVDIPNPSPQLLAEAWARLNPHDKKIVTHIKDLFDQRPIWTRRGLRNRLHAQGINLVQIEHHCFAQLGYSFLSGPWRDTLVRYGIDPRTDPSMRIYQTLSFRTDDMGRVGSKVRKGPREYGSGLNTTSPASIEEAIRPAADQSHIFDGHTVDTRGKLWQICDVTDPRVQELLETRDIRERVNLEDGGWFHNGSWGKIRALTKLKIRHLIEYGTRLEDDHADVQVLLKVPDHITQASFKEALMKKPKQDMTEAEAKANDALRRTMKIIIKHEKVSNLSPGPPGARADVDEDEDEEMGGSPEDTEMDREIDDQDEIR